MPLTKSPEKIAFLMYHELAAPGRDVSRDFPGHLPYAVPATQLQTQIRFLRDHGWHGLSVSEALAPQQHGHPANPAVAFTFDDGADTDLQIAAPLLEKAGFHATFYVIAGWLGRPGYLSDSHIRELHARGFEIGCHSMNHRYLTGLAENELRIEIADAKDRLEQALDNAVHHFSCPGGFWSPHIARLAQISGYRSVATSRIGRNGPASNPYRLSRISILRDLPLQNFHSACRGQGLFFKQARERIAAVPKTILGADLYIRLHAALHRGENNLA